MDSNSVIVIRETTNMITLFGIPLIQGLLTGGFVLLAAYIAYRTGVKAYFKKWEHEQIFKRYLEEGIDLVLVSVNQAFRVYIDNEQKALNALSQVEENQKVDIPVTFETFDRHILELTPYSKITRLVGDQIFENVIGMFLGLIDGQSAFLEEDFQQLRTIITENGLAKTLSPSLTVEEVRESLNEDYKEIKRYFLLIDELRQLTLILEKQTTLTWSDLDEFKNRPEVKESVKKLKDEFREELAKAGKQNNEPKEVEEQAEPKE